jgi:hypothetical protein
MPEPSGGSAQPEFHRNHRHRWTYLEQQQIAREIGMTIGSVGGSAVLRLLATFVAVGAPVSHALASQGPGTTAGGASATTQLGMAILVYGLSAAVVLAGLIGALRQR